MKKIFSSLICLVTVCFLSTNLLAWYPDDIPDLDLNNVDRQGVHTAGTGLPTSATDGWTGGGFWTAGGWDDPLDPVDPADPSYFAYYSPGENVFFDVMWIFVYTQGTDLTDPVVSMENNNPLNTHVVELKYDDDTNYSASSYWPTAGSPEDWNLWVYYIEPNSATEIIYFTQNMHEYDMEIYSQYFIPEPTTILLLLGSIVGLFIKKFKK